MPQNFKAVIFDMDGLMLDTEPIYSGSMRSAAAEMGRSLENELRENMAGRSIPEWEAMLMRTFGMDYPKFRARRREIWEQHVREIGVEHKAGLMEMLDRLDQDGLPKAIATSSSRPDALLCLGDLASRFDVIVTREEVANGKPSPDIFLLAAHRLSCSPSSAWFLKIRNPAPVARSPPVCP